MTSARLPFVGGGAEFTPGLIRKIRRDELACLHAHLLRLDEDDRRMRFCGFASDKTVKNYCAFRSSSHSITLGFFVRGELRGAGEIFLDTTPSWLKGAEMALSVERPYQDRGVGTELLRRLVIIGRNRWISRIRMIWLQENVRMQAVASKFRPILSVGYGQVECEIRPAWPTHFSFLNECLVEDFFLNSPTKGCSAVYSIQT